eukprot:CAMPEP_0202731346 /NCGR_PEP_ID=MMETSP1385-20130828/187105_1 /ASSEMBLY_ACC=CAM_ASM_000861 /TAXON_ID=933848 /ORGANISM="Elphidium margaritaceum" /LENGTH=376 /DNA_ID=CAMNT_0049397641 /DNA_START=24 /DNA_END=1154 /DNA_ORIENTATION=-
MPRKPKRKRSEIEEDSSPTHIPTKRRRSKRIANKQNADNDPDLKPLLVTTAGHVDPGNSAHTTTSTTHQSGPQSRHQDALNSPLFDDTCLYAMLEVFFVAYNVDDTDDTSLRDDLWEWLWQWEQSASAYYRILITPVYEHDVFEIRVDSVHGIACGLLTEFVGTRLTFEYYYSYSRRNIWGGWRFFHRGRGIKHDVYGNLYDENTAIQPSQLWKQIIWLKQLKMELMYQKYGGCNMSKMHLSHYFYAHHNFNEINGDHNVYINHMPPYQNANNSLKMRDKRNRIKRDKFDVYSYHMAQIFDNVWCKQRKMNKHSIRLNHDDVSLMIGTKMKMRCALCHQTYHICRSVHLCDSFKGYFTASDLYQRHKSMVLDWKDT